MRSWGGALFAAGPGIPAAVKNEPQRLHPIKGWWQKERGDESLNLSGRVAFD
jgi:hypothetical protein